MDMTLSVERARYIEAGLLLDADVLTRSQNFKSLSVG